MPVFPRSRLMILLLLVSALNVGLGGVEARAEDPLIQKTVQAAPNLEPVIPHPDQERQAREKLATLAKKVGKKPNIIIFLMDDVGWSDPGCYGGGVAVGAPTPTMDRLAQEGLRLTSCYSQPTCSPTRATIMTGRLPIRHGILRPVMYGEKGGLGGEITMAKILSQAGYVTQAVGKWHMGENQESEPQNVGFDDFYGFQSVSDMYTEWRDPYFFPEIANSPERTEMMQKAPFNKHLVHGKKGGKLENLEEITIPVLAQLDEKWGDYSVNFIKNMATSGKPFFLYHCTRGAHFDSYPNEKFKGKSPAKYPIKDVMVEVDYTLGRLVKVLEETGQLDNTLIFITSDNGPNMESWPDSTTTPFRSSKGSTWEGGMRVPGIVYWRGMVQPGQVSDGLFDLSDLFSTALNLAGAQDKLPKDRFIDGVDQTSFILGNSGDSNRKAVYYWQGDKLAAIRTAEFKMVMFGLVPDYHDSVNAAGLSSHVEEYYLPKLFNLYLDPQERHNYLNRKTTYAVGLKALADRHLETFNKYPAKIVVFK